jgi:leader peptidase (prepilin peptidase)/N-methyltransferase
MDAWGFAAIALGPFAGSFVATLVERLAADRPWAWARSACASCGRALAARDLVPLVSFALARGRCRHCGSPIPAALPIAECVGLLAGVLAAAAASGPAALAGALFGWWLWAAGWLDWRTMWLPHGLTWPLVPLGLAASALGLSPAPLPDAAIGALAGLAAMAALRLGWRRLRGREGMGAGDPPLVAAAGAWVGWQLLPFVLLAAALLGLLTAALRRPPGARIRATTELPFGTYLAAATFGLWIAAMTGR